MGRMIDHIRAGGKLAAPYFIAPHFERTWVKHTTKVVEILRQPEMPVLVIDNVSEYYYTGTDQEYWDLLKDFPNLAPPYKMFWAEHRMARKIHSAEEGDTDVSSMIGPNARIGVFVCALDPSECEAIDVPDNFRDRGRWYLWCELFINYDHGAADRNIIATGPHGSIFLCIDEHGALLEKPWMQSYLPSNADGTVHEAMKGYMTWLHPTFLAMSFLHCKNVRVEEHSMDKPLAKKFRAKYNNTEPVKWKTLVIEPLKQILRQEGKSHEVGLAKAMHICRGHFKDYREGKGLFGKYHGQYYVPAVVRGTRGKLGPRDVEVRVPVK